MNSFRLVREKPLSLVTGSTSSLLCKVSSCQPYPSYTSEASSHDKAVNKEDAKTKPHLLTDLTRGTGGRSSFSGIVATVFGATGVLGQSLVNQLGKIGTQVIVPYRGDKEDVRPLRLTGDLGQILFMPYHLEDEECIRKAVRYSNVVINLVGRFHETRNFNFSQVHVDGAARIARISKEMGVETLLHVSALNCVSKPKSHLFSSKFLRTKALGEVEVRREFPEAIIVRPSYMFGQNDSFLFYFKSKYRTHHFTKSFVVMPMYQGGKAIKQPVFVQDVSKAIVKAIQNPDSHSQTYQAVGPHRYHLADVVRWMYMHMRYVPGRNFYIMPYVDPVIKIRNNFNTFIRPATSQVGLERLEFECHSDIVSAELPTLEDLGVPLISLEDRIVWELRPFRRFNYYMDSLGEFPTPPNPPLVAV